MTEQKSRVTIESKANGVSCRLVQQWLPDFLRGELTAVQQQQILAHLARCDSCAQLVQEARLLDADLLHEADRYQPRLTQAASQRIQRQVYRRMRRSLVWQRTGQVVRLGTALAALLVLLAGSFVFGRFWLQSLANPPAAATTGETATVPEIPQPVPTAVPTVLPAIETVVESTGNGRLNAWDTWTAAAPGQVPEQLATTIMTAALAGDGAFLNNLFVGMGAVQEPTASMWLRIGNRCPQSLNPGNFEFIRRPIPLPTVASVSIWYDNHLVGEIKMRQVAGEWFATFTWTPAVNPCLHQSP